MTTAQQIILKAVIYFSPLTNIHQIKKASTQSNYPHHINATWPFSPPQHALGAHIFVKKYIYTCEIPVHHTQ